MSETHSGPKSTLGERIFSKFSWPSGSVPPALADRPVPVKIGFIEELKALLPPEEHEPVQIEIARWTRGVPYLNAILEPGAMRVDLDGRPVEQVTDKQREHAQKLLEQRQINKARKQHREVIAALDAIDKMFKEPSRENLLSAKKASAEIRRILTGQ